MNTPSIIQLQNIMQSNKTKKSTPPPLAWSDFVDNSYSPDSPTYSPESPTYSPHTPTSDLPQVPTTPPEDRQIKPRFIPAEPNVPNAFELPHLEGRDPVPESPPFVSKIKPRFIPAEPNVPNAFELPHLDNSKKQLSYDGNPITWAPKKKRNNHFVMPPPTNFPQPDFLDIPPPKSGPPRDPVPVGTQLSIIIPWVHTKTKRWFIEKTMSDLRWGGVLGIDMVYRAHNCVGHWKVFVHYGGLSDEGVKAKEHLMKEKNKEIAIQHKYGTWKIRASNWNFDPKFRENKDKPRVQFL